MSGTSRNRYGSALSPNEVLLKRNAIFYHQSQKDRVMYQGNDSREFWVRAEDRNKHTARLYDELGLPEYEAIEALIIKKRNLKRIKIL
jgi:glucosamine-6-phosphate deaminase